MRRKKRSPIAIVAIIFKYLMLIAAAFVALREFCVTVPLTVPVTLLFRAVFRKTHLDD